MATGWFVLSDEILGGSWISRKGWLLPPFSFKKLAFSNLISYLCIMYKVNRTLFDLNTVYTSMTQAEIWDLTRCLRETLGKLVIALKEVNDKVLFKGHLKEHQQLLFEQIAYLTRNIKTLEEALMCHETKIFEKRPSLKDLQVVCLN